MRVFIENAAAATRKNIYDERTLAHLRTVEVSAAYPFPYGFVLGTTSGDGDAVDCFVLTQTPLLPGTIVRCEPIGLVEQIEDGEIDHKVLAALPGDEVRLDAAVVAALKNFSANVFAHVPGKRMEIGRLLGRTEADAYLAQCRAPSEDEGRGGSS
jgi:inorganic pyrophosphatase